MSPTRRSLCRLVIAWLTAALLLAAPSAAIAQTRDVELWRLDCGAMIIDDISYFSDSFAYEGRAATISNGCYLIRNGDRYLLWEAGLPHEVLGNETAEDGWTSSIRIAIVDQLAQIGLSTRQINFLGVSHFHGDHIGQAGDFSQSTLLMSRADVQWLRSRPPGNARRRLAAWFEGESTLLDFEGDHDVFGDGSVLILAMPGHTPGHSALLINLARTGPVLLTGDLYHFRSEIGRRNVSRWNTSRADTLASFERFSAIIDELHPIVVVQHDQRDISRLPAFPRSAR